MPDARSPRLAVLIDADNASAKIANRLFEEIAKVGEASVRRIYGDFADARLKPWTDVLAKHAIIPQQQFAYTAGKNASDIALVIDAMDLLHSGRFDGFCLVSSDSDFTRLASRIREQGLDVFGFGRQSTVESFRQACHRFIYTEDMLPSEPAMIAVKMSPAVKPPTPLSANPPKQLPSPLKKPSAATPIIRKILAQIDGDNGWVELGGLGSRLANLASDFDPKAYGFKKLSDLVKGTNAFDISYSEGNHMRIRARTQSQPEEKANL